MQPRLHFVRPRHLQGTLSPEDKKDSFDIFISELVTFSALANWAAADSRASSALVFKDSASARGCAVSWLILSTFFTESGRNIGEMGGWSEFTCCRVDLFGKVLDLICVHQHLGVEAFLGNFLHLFRSCVLGAQEIINLLCECIHLFRFTLRP